MSKLQYNGEIDINNHKYKIGLSLVEFIEDKVTIIYSPALNLSGYGNTTAEAKASFNIALTEFFRYTNLNKTFNEVLTELGWKIKGGKKRQKMEPPLNTDLISNNPLYIDIINSKNYRVFNEKLELTM